MVAAADLLSACAVLAGEVAAEGTLLDERCQGSGRNCLECPDTVANNLTSVSHCVLAQNSRIFRTGRGYLV